MSSLSPDRCSCGRRWGRCGGQRNQTRRPGGRHDPVHRSSVYRGLSESAMWATARSWFQSRLKISRSR